MKTPCRKCTHLLRSFASEAARDLKVYLTTQIYVCARIRYFGAIRKSICKSLMFHNLTISKPSTRDLQLKVVIAEN